MRKTGKMILTLAMAMIMSLGMFTPAMAITSLSPLQIKVNGKTVKTTDAMPYLDKNGIVLGPVRAVSKALGATTAWNSSSQTMTITKADTVVKLTVGSTKMNINGKAKEMDTKATLKDGKVYAPVRYLGEAFGGKFEWDSDKNIVNIALESTVNGENRGGYIFPKGTSVFGEVQKDSQYIEFMAFVVISSNNTEKNLALYKELRDVIASKHGDAIANEIYEHIKQKEGEYDDLPAKLIYLPEDDQWIRMPRVGVGGKTVTVQVCKKGIDFSEK